MKSVRSARGFTLIELLVVVAIIGILSSVVLVSLNGARLKARDSKRVSDIHQVQNAMELYNIDNKGKYPAASSGIMWLADVSGLSPTYIPTLPIDPLSGAAKTGNDYQYYTNSLRVQGYTLLRYHEGADDWCRVTVGGVIPAEWASYEQCELL